MMSDLQALTYQQFPVSTLDGLLALLLAFALGLYVRFIYRQVTDKMGQDPLFDSVILFVPAILSVIMMLIGSNLSLSIGLVGSLSIIRFRNVVKSSRDMVFLFWLIAIGLGCGTFSYKITFLSSLLIGVGILIAKPWISGKKSSRHQLILRGKGRYLGSSTETKIKKIEEQELQHLMESGDKWEAMFNFPRLESAEKALRDIYSEDITHASIHNNQ